MKSKLGALKLSIKLSIEIKETLRISMLINPVVIVKLLITFKMEMYTCQGKAESTLLRKRILKLIGFLLKFLPGQ